MLMFCLAARSLHIYSIGLPFAVNECWIDWLITSLIPPTWCAAAEPCIVKWHLDTISFRTVVYAENIKFFLSINIISLNHIGDVAVKLHAFDTPGVVTPVSYWRGSVFRSRSATGYSDFSSNVSQSFDEIPRCLDTRVSVSTFPRLMLHIHYSVPFGAI